MNTILIEFGIPMKLAWLIKMCLNESNSRVRVDKYLSVMFRVKNGLKEVDVLSPLLVNFALEYAIGWDQVNQVYLQLNGTHQLVVYAADVNILARSVHTVKEKAETLLVSSKVTGLEVNFDKIKYMIMPRDQNAERSYNIKNDNSSS